MEADPLEKRKAIIGSLGRTPTEDRLTIYIKQESEPTPKEKASNGVQKPAEAQQDGGVASRLFNRYRQQRVVDVPNEILRTIEETDAARIQKETELYDNSPAPLPKKVEETAAEREKKRYQRTMVALFLIHLISEWFHAILDRLPTPCDRSSRRN